MFSVTGGVNMSIVDTHRIVKATHDSNFFGSMCVPFWNQVETLAPSMVVSSTIPTEFPA